MKSFAGFKFHNTAGDKSYTLKARTQIQSWWWIIKVEVYFSYNVEKIVLMSLHIKLIQSKIGELCSSYRKKFSY